ncbi:hypothetical protein [Rhizobium sp. BK176]|uniref:hypothetical protein n=1 Tax=Rhizobium sp. BK176 TaxID=2587071 RepID=UPI002167499E|nr:hypothetical protein [Rhizobium sp. BK176]MCS4088622.1 hypothetical protein [Rhizobium sp. BK176]
MAEKPPGKNLQHVAIPERMRSLPVDPRGYPVPVVVTRDRNGKPNFAANDESIRQTLFREDRCGICGGKLLRGRWSVGGPGSALHPDGAFLDPPMHYECARYAVQVCPYLAMPSYSKSVSKIAPMSYGPSKVGISYNPTVFSNRPDLFLLVMYVGQKLSYDGQAVRSLKPKRPFRTIEYWREGVWIADAEGRVAAERYLQEQDAVWEAERKRSQRQSTAIIQEL